MSVIVIGKKSIEVKLKNLIHGAGEKLAEKTVERCRELVIGNITMYDAIDTGEMLSSVSSEVSGKKGSVTVGSGHAAYVEFGTGVVGEMSPHPNPEAYGWEYDVNNHGIEGWDYIKNGKKYHTIGMQSRPFMYLSSVQLDSEIPKIFNEVLKENE